MRHQKLLTFSAVAVCALVLGHGLAAAQAQGQAAPPPDANAGMVRQVNLSPQEQAVQSESLISRMDAARNQVRQDLEKARVARDVVKTLCLNDKLNQLDVAIRSARERRESLSAAVSRNDADLASHEFTILTVLRSRSEQLTAEAHQCIGSEATITGENDVKTTIDPGIVSDPSAFNPPNGTVIVEPPSCASCTK